MACFCRYFVFVRYLGENALQGTNKKQAARLQTNDLLITQCNAKRYIYASTSFQTCICQRIFTAHASERQSLVRS